MAANLTAAPMASFCASLRRRPEWAAAVPSLLQSSSPKWRGRPSPAHGENQGANKYTYKATTECRLTAVELTVPRPGTPSPDDVFSFALLSAADVGQPATDARLDRLLYAQGGRNVAVVFLAAAAGDKKGSVALQELQFRYAIPPSCLHPTQPTRRQQRQRRTLTPPPNPPAAS